MRLFLRSAQEAGMLRRIVQPEEGERSRGDSKQAFTPALWGFFIWGRRWR
jgi:hypothetical protein